jgi:HSP20 family protein
MSGMFGLTRFRPISGLGSFDDMVKSIFRDTVPISYGNWAPALRMPAMDLLDKETHYLLALEVPGFKKDDIEIMVEDNVLTLKGETRKEEEEKKENYYHKEISQGCFTRSVRLPLEVKKDDIKASLADGILHVEIPKAEIRAPEKIKVEVK